MNGEVLEQPHAPCPAAIVSHSSDILPSILQPAVQLVLWQRPRPFALDWIDTLDWDEINDIDARIAGPAHNGSTRPLAAMRRSISSAWAMSRSSKGGWRSNSRTFSIVRRPSRHREMYGCSSFSVRSARPTRRPQADPD